MEMTVNFRKSTTTPTHITLGDSDVNTVESSCFLSTIISQDLKRELNISV